MISDQIWFAIYLCPSSQERRLVTVLHELIVLRVATEHSHKHSNLFECNSIRLINLKERKALMPMSLTGRRIRTTVLCWSLVFSVQLPALIHSMNRDLSRDVRGQSNAFWCRSGCSPRLWEREWLIFLTIWISFNCSFVSNQWLVSQSLSWSILSICSLTRFVSLTAATWQRTITMDSLKLSSPLRMLQRRKNDETLFIEVNVRAGSLLNRIHWETTRIMARTNRFRAEDQLSALLVEHRLTNDRNLCQLFDEQVKRKPKSALEQCTSLFEFSSFFIEMNSYRVWHSRLGSTERPTEVCVSHRATATRMVNVDFHSIGPSTVSLNSLVSVFSLSEESSSVGERGAGFALLIIKMKHNTIFGKTLLVHIVQKRVCYSCTFHGRKAKSYNDVLARSRAAGEHLHSSSRATATRTPTTVTERNFVH